MSLPRRAVVARDRRQQLADALGDLAVAAAAREPVFRVVRLLEVLDVLDREPGAFEERAPLRLGVAANVRRVAQFLGQLLIVGAVERVLDHDGAARDARHLGHRRADVGEVVRRDPRDDDVERAVRKRQCLGRADDIGLHAGRGVEGDDFCACLAQTARNVPTAGRDVERRDARDRAHRAPRPCRDRGRSHV